MLNLEVFQILESSSAILGYFPDEQLSSIKYTENKSNSKSKGSPPSFLTINLTYIDLLK